MVTGIAALCRTHENAPPSLSLRKPLFTTVSGQYVIDKKKN